MNMIAKSAVAIATVPAVTVSMPKTVKAMQETFGVKVLPECTPIGKLWAEREAVHQQYRANKETRREVEQLFHKRMPKPDPLITYNEASKADLLRCDSKWGLGTVHDYIRSDLIEKKLEAVTTPRTWDSVKIDNCQAFVQRKEPAPLPAEDIELSDRLRARLDLSQKYERKIKRVRRELGMNALAKKSHHLCNLQNEIEDRILALPSTCSADLAIKLAIHDFHRGCVGEESIISDARNLAKDAQRAAFADPRDYLVFLATEYLAVYEQCGPGISDAQTALPLIAKKKAA